MEGLCGVFDLTRQGYCQARRAAPREALEAEMVVQLVREVRHRMPRLGGRKLYHLLRADLAGMGLKLGRDGFFAVLRERGLLAPPRRRGTRTTNSFHRFRVWPNLLGDLALVRPNQAWGSDITYLRTWTGFLYLFLVTDLYSRKIVGWALRETLEARGALEALEMALGATTSPQGLIHHSDRGAQYCCDDYVARLRKHGIGISMAEVGNPYENAIPERVNGILKSEFYLDETFASRAVARCATRDAIGIYNHERPHMSLGLMTPAEKHAEKVTEAA